MQWLECGCVVDGKRFLQFVRICVQAYLVLRRNAQLIISLFAMMLSTGIPEVGNPFYWTVLSP
jgi:phosphatidylinositol kinase/protein kinase (PI-3  family)